MQRMSHIARHVSILAALALAIGAVSAAAAAGPELAVPSAQASDTIRLLGPEPTQGLDPNIAAADASRGPDGLMFDTLVDYDESGHLAPALAESYSASPDNTVWTFRMRSGAMFSDGSPITADDAKFSIDRMRQGQIMKGLLSNITDVTVTDPQTVVVTLSASSRALPLALSRLGSAAILSQAAVSANSDYFAQPTTVSGPYVLSSYIPKDREIFTANPHYWRSGFPKTPTIQHIFSEDQNSWAAAIESGSADVASVGYADAQRLRQAGRIPVQQSDLLTPLFWGWDTTKPPFDNIAVRQAFAYAVDREGRQAACWFDTGASTYGNILRPWDPYYTEINTYKLDRPAALAKAGQLFDQAGWKLKGDMREASGVTGETDGTKFSVQVPYEGNWPAAECNTLLLQSTMKQVGIDIQPVKYDPAPFWGDVAANKFQMYHGGAGATNADDLYLNWFRTGGALTPLTTHLANKAIDAKIDAAEAAPDEATAKQIFAELEQQQSDQLPLLVTGYQWGQVATAPNLSGYYSRPDGAIKWIINATVGQ